MSNQLVSFTSLDLFHLKLDPTEKSYIWLLLALIKLLYILTGTV